MGFVGLGRGRAVGFLLCCRVVSFLVQQHVQIYFLLEILFFFFFSVCSQEPRLHVGDTAAIKVGGTTYV